MVKAGFSGSGINDIVYMGGVVNMASKHCSKANKEVNCPLVISEPVWNDLSGYGNGNADGIYQTFFTKHATGYYYGEVVNIGMNNWLIQQT